MECRKSRCSKSSYSRISAIVHEIEPATYELERDEALLRIGDRDPDDWPILASALTMRCPIWTEDKDFFGTGVATWTTNLVHLYLSAERPIAP